MIKYGLFKLCLLLALGAFSISASAGDHRHDKDHDMARQALLNGEILPLQDVLNIVGKTEQGTPIKIEFDHDDGLYQYKIKLLRNNGNVAKLKVDAKSGKILKIKERGKK